MDILCTFKIKIENWNSKTSGYIQIKSKMQNHSQEPLAQTKTQNQEAEPETPYFPDSTEQKSKLEPNPRA